MALRLPQRSELWLFDCGEGTQHQFLRSELRLSQLRKVFIFMLANITAIILTNNEEKHMERCIISLKDIVKRIVVIDSFSTDTTLEILKNHNIEFYQKEWVNYSSQ